MFLKRIMDDLRKKLRGSFIYLTNSKNSPLLTMKKDQFSPQKYICAKQVAAILSVSLPQVYAKASSKQWPSYRIHGMRGVRFIESEIRELVVENSLDKNLCLDIGVPKISVAEVTDYVESIQTRRNMVDRFLCGRP